VTSRSRIASLFVSLIADFDVVMAEMAGLLGEPDGDLSQIASSCEELPRTEWGTAILAGDGQLLVYWETRRSVVSLALTGYGSGMSMWISCTPATRF
jgi:hypothetical protein